MRIKIENVRRFEDNLIKYVKGKRAGMILNRDVVGVQSYCDTREQCEIVPAEFINQDIHISVDRSEPRVSEMAGIALNGNVLKPFLITKGNLDSNELLQNRVLQNQNTIVVQLTTGTMNFEFCIRWVKEIVDPYFVNQRKIEGLPRNTEGMLLVDNLAAHCTKEIQALLTKCHIILLTMTPNATHLLQPCDVGVFGALKIYYQQEKVGISKMSLGQIMANAINATQKTATIITIGNSFRACGIKADVQRGKLVAAIDHNAFVEMEAQITADNAAVPDASTEPVKRKRVKKFGALNVPSQK
ncbi:MAG: hypothetical protein EZS28_049547 [Streblomastix strix]|uniref:DDE-1 domain-containing protein n=1 Tax=Streblomastix strix TaxID=222440 RepID=A0A5J4T911_9EUKA|nr:MAG: hypothetical protein EZS28_049547 [Streblomastix strix]